MFFQNSQEDLYKYSEKMQRGIGMQRKITVTYYITEFMTILLYIKLNLIYENEIHWHW